MPKRAARALRLESSESRVVEGRFADREGFEGAGVSVSVSVSVVVVVGFVVEEEGSVVVVGGSTVKSEVLEGSVDGIWLGTVVGLAG